MPYHGYHQISYRAPFLNLSICIFKMPLQRQWCYLRDKFHFIQVDLDRPLEEQGPFDLIIQKITDCMAAATDGNSQAFKTMKGLEVSKYDFY